MMTKEQSRRENNKSMNARICKCVDGLSDPLTSTPTDPPGCRVNVVIIPLLLVLLIGPLENLDEARHAAHPAREPPGRTEAHTTLQAATEEIHLLVLSRRLARPHRPRSDLASAVTAEVRRR